VENSISFSKRIGKWFGLTGDYQPRPGETLPLWYKVPKAKYLAISISVTAAAVALFFILTHEGVDGSFAAIFSVQFLALVELIFERANVKFHAERSGRSGDEAA
jgi:hypothetical protein